ncbi:hypothetical protein [Gordonia tangerina]|uniref:Uncharacterized protein n=1 Tax=Gordonia tangerina TaxID=2911060 RepID=A0ABS9DN91_9ACTN|nr:hypothetical protein [Gordonia tangerina]MCF3940622.1 hypothetical protein [Gordonia tangerina]
MAWTFTNITVSRHTREVVRAISVLQAGNPDLVPLHHVHNMVDLTDHQWTLALAELDAAGYAAFLTDDHHQDCVHLSCTPRYSDS